MTNSEASGSVLRATGVDITSLSVRNLFYFFPMVLILGRWYFSAFFLVLLFILLVLEKLMFDRLELKISHSFYWMLAFIWGLYITAKSPKVWNGLMYYVGEHPFYDGIAYYIGLFIIPFMIMTFFRNIELDESFLSNMMNVFTISGIILSLISAFQFIESGFNTQLRIHSLWPDVNIIAAYLMIIFFFNLASLVSGDKKEQNLLRYASIMILGMGIFFTQTRGVWLAIVVSVVVFFVKRPKIIIPSFLVIALFLLLFKDAIMVRYVTFVNFSTDISTLGRFQAWYATFLLLKDNLLTGYGFDAFLYYKDTVYSGFLLFLPHSHNTYLRGLLEMGLIGTVIYFFLFFKAIVVSFRMKATPGIEFLKKYIDGLQLSFIGLVLVFMFEPYFSLYSNAAIVIWIFISLSICLKEKYY